MPTCTYCEESFDEEDAYLAHLADAHENDLGTIDRRRVAEHRAERGGGGPSRQTLIASAVVVLALVAVGAYAVAGGPGGGPVWQGSGSGSGGDGGGASGTGGGGDAAPAPTPHDVWDVHYHGTIRMTVDGERIRFTGDYQLRADAFHFENGDGVQWHGHARGVTLQWAMATLDIGVTADTVTFEGTTYRDGENADVSVTVDGQAVTPRTYVLQEGDAIEIVVDPY